jgi:phospholipid/cholesterol/gamma-HCH transport system ATP-binding protein
MSEREKVIEVRGLRNQFGAQVVHENLDLDVYKGEILGVVGGSGSGKSVLLRSSIGLNKPAAGSVKVFGQDVTRLSDRERTAIEQRCGVLFQNGALFSSLTVTENVMVPMREHHDLPESLTVRLAALKIALAGLPAEAGAKYPSELSGGMVKRAALARSLALDPDILFLDEPTAGLDPIGAAAFDELILTLRESLGLTVFLITHDLDTLYTICDRVAVIAKKRVLIADTLDKVERFDEPWVHEYFQGPRGRAAEHAALAHMKQESKSQMANRE